MHVHFQGRESGNGAHLGKTGLGCHGGGLALGQEAALAVHDAVAAVHGAAVVVAFGIHIVDERGTQRSVGAHRREPQDGHEEVQRHDGPVIICSMGPDGLLGDDGVNGHDERQQALENRELANPTPAGLEIERRHPRTQTRAKTMASRAKPWMRRPARTMIRKPMNSWKPRATVMATGVLNIGYDPAGPL